MEIKDSMMYFESSSDYLSCLAHIIASIRENYGEVVVSDLPATLISSHPGHETTVDYYGGGAINLLDTSDIPELYQSTDLEGNLEYPMASESIISHAGECKQEVVMSCQDDNRLAAHILRRDAEELLDHLRSYNSQ